jgi:AcrR family transcriptional regulator
MGKLDTVDSTAQKLDGRLEKGKRARAAIIASAVDVFSAKGYDGAQTSEIAKMAGYAESTVFLHFKNKRGLVLAIMQAYYQDLMDGANLILKTTDDAEEQLIALTRHYLVELAKGWKVVRLFGNHARYTESETFDEFTKYNRIYTKLYIDIFERLKADKILRSDIDSRQLRDMLFGAIEHYAIANFRKKRAPDIGEFMEGTFSVLFYGASDRKPPAQPVSNGESIERKLDSILALLKDQAE